MHSTGKILFFEKHSCPSIFFYQKFTDVLFKSADKHFNIQPVYQYFILPFNKRIC